MAAVTPVSPFEEAQQILEAQQFHDALPLFTKLYQADPGNRKIRIGFGAALLGCRRFDDVVAFIEKLGGPDCPENIINLASALRQLNRLDEEYTVLKGLLQYVVAGVESHLRHLAVKAQERSDWATQFTALSSIRLSAPDDRGIVYALFNAAVQLKRGSDALLYGRRFLDLAETPAERATVYSLLSGVLKDAGDTAGAIDYARKTAELSGSPYLRSNLIMTMQYAHGVTMADYYRDARAYERAIPAVPYLHGPLDPGKVTQGLHIGFLSGDFIGHSLTALLLKIFQQFTSVGPRHTYTIYYSRPDTAKDMFSAMYAAAVTTWRDVKDLSDDDTAALIKADGVDVLIELAGHTAENRLPVFVRRPAPVQIGWVSGMMSPPGFDCIPYFLADADMIPSGQQGFTTIPVVSSYIYDPIANAPGIKAEPPMVKNGYITYGNFNNPCKLNAEVLMTWLTLLKQVPKSRLHTKVYGGITEEWFKKSAVTLGVDPARITFIHNLPRTEDVMAYYTNQIDVALDTWPCAGMLTSLESMWMGVPVMTLRGDTFLHHQTASILKKLDLPEFGVDTPGEFIKAAAALAKRPDLLGTFRGTIREKMTASVIRKPDIVAASILDGIGKAWVHRCRIEKDLQGLVKTAVPA